MKTNLSKIYGLLKNLGKCKIEFNASSQEFTYNNITPKSIPITYFKDIKEDFYKYLSFQLAQSKIDKKLIDSFLDILNKNINVIVINKYKHNVEFSSISEKSQDLILKHELINEIYATQSSVIIEIRTYLIELSQGLNYLIDEDIKNLNVSENLNSHNDLIKSPEIGKLVFKLSKKDTANFITLLEYLEIIDFNGVSRNQFIETNFQYWSKNNLPSDITKINSDIANLHDTSGDFGSRNSKSMSLLLQNLKNKFDKAEYIEFAKWLKSKI